MKKNLLILILFFLFAAANAITPQELLSLKDQFLGFPVQEVQHEYYDEQLYKTRITFCYPEVTPYEVTAAFTEKYECQLDEMNSTDYMVCYKLDDGNLAIFSLSLNFTLEIVFSSQAVEKYNRTKPLID